MTEQKPVAWICEYTVGGGEWYTMVVPGGRPREKQDVRNIRPLYEHPAPSQPASDPAVEAARRKALRTIFKALDKVSGYSDGYSVRLAAGVLRDLIGDRPDDTRVRICGYDKKPFGQVPEQGPEQPVPMPSWALKNVDEMAQNLYETNLEQRGFAWSVLQRSSKDIWRERARRFIERTSKVAE